MNKTILFLSAGLLLSCSEQKESRSSVLQTRETVSPNLQEFPVEETTIRALAVENDSTVWFGGSNGKWGYTENNGEDWHMDYLSYQGDSLEIRSIKVLDNGDVFLLGVAKPAVLFKTTDKGKSWNMVYKDSSSNAFFDAVDFWDDKNGLLVGDAQAGCFHLAITSDGGDSWSKVHCDSIPEALEGEGPFAASNTNISIYGNYGWFATGGMTKSRVFKTSNYGRFWTAQETPVISGQQMTGIFSIDFKNEQLGLVAGGNWEEVSEAKNTLALTTDGGITWKSVGDSSVPGYFSCVQFIPSGEGREVFALQGRARGGETAMAYSNNGGVSWQTFDNSNYISIQFASHKVAWLGGKNKIAKLTLN